MIDRVNPLFEPYNSPYGAIPFDKIEKADYLPAVERGIKRGLAEINEICDNQSTPDFENTIVALENSGKDLDRVLDVFGPLLSALSDDEMMALSTEIMPKVSEYSTAISLNVKLWERVKHVYDNRESIELDDEDKMLLQRTYDSFARKGALLKGESRDEYKKLVAELSDLTTRFGQNVLKELNTYEIWLGKDDLSGLPDGTIESAAEAAKEKGREGEYLFTLSQPTYISFLKYSDRADLREKMWRLYTGRNIHGEFSNVEIIKDITAKRLRIANLLGYENYAAYSLEHTMAHDVSSVYALLNRLKEAYAPALKAEMSEIVAYASEMEKRDVAINPWDYSYYANKLKEAKYSYDEEKLRPYFDLNKTISGVFGLAERMYGISFEEIKTVPVYHPDVKVFEVKDTDGTYLGLLYTDFFPRDTKRPGAWMTEFKAQWREDEGEDSRPHISIVMNFTKSTSSKPSLLTPYEVSTFLHEFGHALHGLLSKVKYSSLSGTNVYRDFVELPSQFNENFLRRREFLDSFASHYLTGEPIPQELVDKIITSSQFGAAYACMRQLGFGYIDMAWHTITEPVDDVQGFENKSLDEVRVFNPEVDSMISPQFSHIFAGGYAAGYYSYKWAEVLDADAFAKFEEDGVMNAETAMAFRRSILERGATIKPQKLYEDFRGQEASIDALLRRDGIVF